MDANSRRYRTSNPTIFAKAICGSDLYDGQLRGLASGGEGDTQELFFELAPDDVRAAARQGHAAVLDRAA